MTLWSAVLLACIACMLLKLAGYLTPTHWLDKPRTARITDLLTVALLAALVATQTLASGQSIVLDARVPAVIVAAILLSVRAPFLLVVLAGTVTAALLRLWGLAA